MILWFGISVLFELGSSLALRWFLRRRGVHVSSMLFRAPGYLERLYVQWCRTEGRTSNLVVTIRIVSIVNVVAAAICFYVMVSGGA